MDTERKIALLGFAAWSGTGKTTLLVKLLEIFTGLGLRAGVVKHAHHAFDIDLPGKDSYVLRKAGASQVFIGSGTRWALITETPGAGDPSLDSCLARMDLDGLDLVLVEGFKPEPIPKIELHRPALGRPLLFPGDPDIIAVATDAPLGRATELPLLDLNDAPGIARFIIDRFLPGSQTGERPTTNTCDGEQDCNPR